MKKYHNYQFNGKFFFFFMLNSYNIFENKQMLDGD